jgi:cellulose synthase/poly-beta-1,6-N-acetylglucosamine synthase-like glycosyltransferase
LIEIVLVAALAVLAYTYVGYPSLIWVLARCFPRAVHRGAYEPRVAVIIVAHNEAARIVRKLDTCIALDYPKEKLRILVASDGSDDETNEMVIAYADRGVTLLAFPARRGKAACLNDAVASCNDEIVLLTDARQRLDSYAIRYLIENFADPFVGAASGELVFETDGMTEFGEGVDAYWRYEKFIRQQESRFHSVVGVTGALYALRRECFREIPADTILDDVVIPMNVVMAGKRVVFENRAMAFDMPSRDHRQEKLRKVRTIAGNYQLIAAHPSFFVPLRNPIFFQLVSHKALRLVSPLCMALALVANALLAPRAILYQCLLAAQLLAYAVPAMGFLWPSFGRWKVVKLATAFVLLNWFAVLGFVEVLRNRNVHLWSSKQSTPSSKTPV